MPRTLVTKAYPGSRIPGGDAILAAAATTNTKPIRVRLDAFRKAHVAYTAADALVDKADAALRAQQEKVGEADAAQDTAVLAVASALAGDGLLRANPFKPLGFAAPSKVVELGYGDEAKVVGKLAKKVGSHAAASKKSKDAAKAAGKAADAVVAAIAPIAKLTAARTQAIAKRDALAQPWETALAALRRGARAAEDDGARGLYATLFQSTAAPRPKAKPKAKATPAGTTPAPAPAPVIDASGG